jgi:transcriptional regulator with XRE-family HTH domain
VPRISGQTDADGQLKQLGEAIRARRKLRELTQEALADAAGIDRSHMGKIERGERNVTLLNIIRIAKALDTLPSTLFLAAGM